MNDNKLCAGCTTDERDGDGYEALLAGIRRNFSKAVKDESTPLFTTEAPDLYAVFLERILDRRMNVQCNIADLMLIYLYLKPFLQNRTDIFRRLVFHMEQRPDIACQRITDLFLILYPLYRKSDMICHGEENTPVNPSEYLFCFL